MGKRIHDLTHQRFGRLEVLSIAGRNRFGHVLWQVRCDCGVEFHVRGSDLLYGKTKSCGCMAREINSVEPSRRKEMSKEINIY